jgi:hypothetical protein
MAAALGWKLFYAIAMLSSLPAMILMLVILRWYPPQGTRPQSASPQGA